MMMEIGGIRFGYGSSNILEDVTFSVGKGDMVAILGPNGAGKSTLLKCIDGINRPSSGTVVLEDEDLADASRRKISRLIAYVPQRGDVSGTTVFESVLLGRKPHIEINPTRYDLALVGKVIEMMGLGDIASEPIDRISGGEHQLVQIARAVVQHPKTILLDEPTNNLDPANQHMIMHAIRDVVKENGMSAVMVMHDLNLALNHCDGFVFMRDGKVAAAGGKETVTPELIREVYGIDVYVETVHGVLTIIPKGREG